MAFHRCVDCLLHRMEEKNLSVEKAALYANLAVTIIDGNALCAEHAENALSTLIERKKQAHLKAKALLDRLDAEKA